MSSPFSSRAVLCVMEPTNKSRENTLLSFSISNRTKTPPHPLFHLAFPPESLVIPSHALLRLVSWLTPNQIAPSPTPHTHRVFRTRTLPFSAPQAKLNQQASRPTGHPIDRVGSSPSLHTRRDTYPRANRPALPHRVSEVPGFNRQAYPPAGL
ncbi:hypothetical protein BC567DRAFT_74338 [Phyllosticta citribraziliensis]